MDELQARSMFVPAENSTRLSTAFDIAELERQNSAIQAADIYH